MLRAVGALLVTLLLITWTCSRVIAGSFDDALAADKRGDYATAVKLYRPLAEKGDATVQHNLGYMYNTGHGVPLNFFEAAKWYRKAAEQGYAPSQFNLGMFYFNGTGVLQDYPEAVRWFRKAAEQGLVPAQIRLGLMYGIGGAVERDDAEAAKWYRRAADQGDAGSRYVLAKMYLGGEGVKQDTTAAYKWSSLALAQGNAAAKIVRDLAISYMSPAEVAEAKKQDEFYRRYSWFMKYYAKVAAIKQDPKQAERFAKRVAEKMKPVLPKSAAEVEFIHAIQFVDETEGFALDFNGNIHETHDAGLSWSQKPLPLDADLKERLFKVLTKPVFRSPEFLAMHFADKEFGMALDRLDPVVTRDGGRTWVGVPRPPTKDQLRALWCTKKHTCFVGGKPNDVIYVLRDGEKQWTLQRTSAGCCLFAIQFVNDLKGWAVSNSGAIIRTENGGTNWERVFSDNRKKFWNLNFPTDKLGFAVGENGLVMRTVDGGNTWQDISANIRTPISIPKEALRFHAVRFADEKHGWIAGRYGIIFATSDEGKTWRLVSFQGVEPAKSSLTIYALEVTPQKVWAAGNLGNILVSIDDGTRWFPVHGAFLDATQQMKQILDEFIRETEKR